MLDSKDNNKKPQNARGAKTVNPEVFKRLKLSYEDNFHGSPSKFRERLDRTFADEIKRAKDGSGSLLSDKTIRNFFAASEPPKASTKTLNYLCKEMLGYDSYGEAVRILEQQAINTSSILSKNTEVQEKVNFSEAWLEAYRNRVRDKWGQMKILDMSESLSLESIYSDTYFLKSIKSRRQVDYENSLTELISTPQVSGYSYAEDERISGLEKIKESSKLLILGVGGSGKTSFLRYLSLRYLDTQVSLSDFGIELISVYIHLRICADEIVGSGMKSAIINNFKESLKDEILTTEDLALYVERMLKNGQLLILFDAIDESSQKIDEVIRLIKNFVDEYSSNRVIVTCRLETTERQFDKFDEVEIADFSDQQVEVFVKKWFDKHGKPKLGDRFIEQRKLRSAIRDLTKNPLALTYLCLVFRENLGFSKDTSGIYDDVVDIFLRKWDYSRDIEDRTPVSDKLSYGRKLIFFRQLAYQGITTEPPKFLWKDRDLKKQIRKFIEKVSKVKEEEIDQDTDLVLKVVIRDHGLLVPQSRDWYGFPHRTFQEYFTAKYIVLGVTNNPSMLVDIINKYLTNREWETVFLMITELSEDADGTFRLMFNYINKLVSGSENLQKMLTWLHEVTQSFEVNSSSWRSLCLAIDLDIELYISGDMSSEVKIYAQDIPFRMKEFNNQRNKIVPNNPKLVLALYLAITYTLAVDKGSGQDPRLGGSTDYIKKVLAIKEDTNIKKEMELAIAKAEQIIDLNPNLIDELRDLQAQQPSSQTWKEWAESLRQLMLTHLNIGHHVKLSREDEKILADYLYANNLLIKCICGDSLSTRSLREQIFDHILLPKAFIPMI